MPFVMNALNREVSTQAHGNWFTFPPHKIKMVNDNLAAFLIADRAYMGFVKVSDKFEDPDYKSTEEGRKELEEAKKKGVNNRCSYLRAIIRNETESLKQDLMTKNITSDPAGIMSDGMLQNLEELGSYQKAQEDDRQVRENRVKELMAKIKKEGV